MLTEIHAQRFFRLVLIPIAMVVAACGGSSGSLDRFACGETIRIETFADVEIADRVPNRVASVQPIPSGLTVPRSGVAIFSATATDTAGRFLADVEFEWRIRDPLAGTLSENGVFTAGNVPGTYDDALEVIAVQRVGELEFTAVGSTSVVVTSGLVDTNIVSVIVFPSTASGRPGDTVPLRAAALGAQGVLVQDLDLFWRVTDPDVGEIDENGILTIGDLPGDYQGAVVVEARRLSGAGAPVLGRASVRVFSEEEANRGVRAIIGPSAVVGRSGGRVPLVLLTFDFNGRAVEIDEIHWDVLVPDVGIVDDQGRFVIGETPGQYPASVKATAELGGDYAGRTATAFLDVVVQSPLSIGPQGVPGKAQILPSSIRLFAPETARLSAIWFDAEGTLVSGGETTWEYDPSLVTVDSRGRLTVHGEPGSYANAVWAFVPGLDGGVQRVTASVTILGPLTRVEVIPKRATLEVGDLVQFVARAFDGADNRLFDVRFRWELEPGAPGTITANGLYIAGDQSGFYPEAVRLRATQRVPR